MKDIKIHSLVLFAFLSLYCLGQKKEKATYNPEFTHNLIEANRQKILGNFDAVKTLYEQCLKLDPNSAVIHYELASYYVHKNDLHKSIGYALKAVNLEPQNIWYKALLGVLYKQTHQYSKAIKIYTSLINKNPERVDFYYELAYLYLYVNRLNQALKIFNTIENRFGLDENVVLEKERIYIFKKQYEKAEKEIQKLINLNPNEIRYYGMLAESYVSQNKLDKAQELYNKMIEIDSTNGLVNLSLADFYRIKNDLSKSFHHLQIAFKSEEIDVDTKLKMLITLSGYHNKDVHLSAEVEKLLTILLNYYPDNTKVLTLYADILLNQNKNEEGYRTLLKIVDLDPSKSLIWEQLLMIEYNLQLWDSLFIHSQQAIDYFPLQATFYYFNAIAAFELKKYELADLMLQKVQTLPISNKDFLMEIYALHGEVLHALGKNSDSDIKLEKALEIDQNNTIVLNNYSYYLSLRSDSLDKAERMSRLCVKMEPNNPTFLDTHAWVLYKQNKLEEALKYIEKAYLLQKNQAIIIEHYGDILYRLGKHEEAFEKWNEALKVGKGSPYLEQKIQQKKLIE